MHNKNLEENRKEDLEKNQEENPKENCLIFNSLKIRPQEKSS